MAIKNILISGGSGLIGKKVTSLLESRGYNVAWLSRSLKRKKKKRKTFLWDIDKGTLEEKALIWCDGIIHLAGAGVAEKQWTEERKREILESRIKSARLLFDHIKAMDKKPQVIISASGIGYYGYDTGKELLNEESPAGNDLLAKVVIKWEEEVLRFQSLGIRTVILRTGTVLDKKGGALPEMLKAPVAAPLGSGSQYISWIHIQDLAQLYAYSLFRDVSGIFNAVAPHPVTNRDLIRLAAKEKGKLFLPVPVPAFLLKAILGEMANIVTGGSKVSCAKIQKQGFSFQFPYIDEALKEIYHKNH